ncbi:polyhydroxyalkanoate depolymerase [Rickettsiales endosymbiont of Stachyamoeba lipophora]|uniref:polyhydroxyalkanoate depolymerase n=1 Tax=Rickettsiales endosymbiont of Stachyamoeba lipophora TaxID=2486578 RepID=UPI000F656095|nr:polyhydroxyalkanoate depolymerase [Rickettsiales endosymbiont of Stachyamoeba lipophora]AZL15656.1 polyhydroxyalkanoate depolymerase [Rickettsiales endosymbiont of Stachyamoeba lipophora]
MFNFPTPIIDNKWLYFWVELFKKNKDYLAYYINYYNFWRESQPDFVKDSYMVNSFDASIGMIERIAKKYDKPEFGIKTIIIGDKEHTVTEIEVLHKPFCRLLHFKKSEQLNHPKMLIVAPLSGHYATLLRGTVRDSLQYFDVYITDWTNASEVPLSKGKFDLDDYIYYLNDFIKFLGTNLSVMAVCQPTVPVLASVALLAAEGNEHVKNMVLMGGPVDARASATEVTKFAEKREMNWFESNVITRVPINYPGFMRAVYPGFIQLAGFMSMNMQRHLGEFMKLYQHLIVGNDDSAEAHIQFYDEYLSVMDISAEFYLQTIKTVFKDFALPLGKMYVGNQKVRPEAITNTSLLVIEGELDDISGVGQTKAALKICKNIPQANTHYHLQPGVGHYGVFNGRKFREQILPVIRDFCYASVNSSNTAKTDNTTKKNINHKKSK